MKFKYKKFAPYVLRPVIPIGVSYGDVSVKYHVLVDSGADMCLFDSQIAELLGILVESGEERVVTGVTANPQPYYNHRVTLDIGGHAQEVEVGFMPNFASTQYGIVGQLGFFDLGTVKFDYQKEEVEIRFKEV